MEDEKHYQTYLVSFEEAKTRLKEKTVEGVVLRKAYYAWSETQPEKKPMDGNGNTEERGTDEIV